MPGQTYTLKCQECGVMHEAKTRQAKYCPDCRALNQVITRVRRGLQAKFTRLAITNPEVAKTIERDMEQEDGPDFREYALDGILSETQGGS